MNPDNPPASTRDEIPNPRSAEEDGASSPELSETVIHLVGEESIRILPGEWDASPQGGAAGRYGVRAAELSGEFGRYRIEGKLGAGGMGAVYVAYDTQLDRRVALKVPFFGDGDGPDMIERFYREARAMATLQHANLCPVFDVGETDGVHYLTMALIAGRPFSDELKPGEPWPARETATIVRRLAQALQSAHESGIVHRDLKPGNVMLRSDGEPVLMDFGLARRHREGEALLTQSGAVLGTPAYMSPEQVKGEVDRIGPATDIYALGVMLYQMLTGRLPFSGSPGSLMAKILTEEPPRPREIQGDVDPGLEAICLKAMSRRIEDRYGTAADLAADLDRLLDGGESVAAAGGEGRGRSERQRVRRRIWIAGVTVLAATGLVFGIAALLNRGPDVHDRLPGGRKPPDDVAGGAVVNPLPLDESWRLPPEPRRYPSFPEAISAPPPWLLADEGAPFDIAAHFEMPVREDNAAPLYLDAFYEFNTEFETCFPESERAGRTQAIAERMQRFVAVHTKWGEDPDSVTLAEVDAVLREFEPAFQKLAWAQRRQECVFETGISSTSLMPMASAVRQIARVTQLRVWRLTEHGDLDRAIGDLAVLSRMTRDLNHVCSLLTYLVAGAVDFLLCDILRGVLLDRRLTPGQCDQITAVLDVHDSSRDETIRLALQQEYVLFRITLHDIQYRTGDFSPEGIRRAAALPEFAELEEHPATPGQMYVARAASTGEPVSESPLARSIDAMDKDDFAREIPIANDGFRSLLGVFDMPVHERYGSISRLWDRLARNQDSRIYRYTMPELLQVFEAYRRNWTCQKGFRCLICLRRWQIMHEGVPPDLASVLHEAGVSETPIDPYGHGEPLRLAVIDGEPFIYSVGPDGNDDGGLIEWNLFPGTPGDITFRLETREEYDGRRQANR